ncbi:hypothetical protein [Kineococcus arenarius]|uniref:hypothetical protein n=1 Tax=Kineococcus sp. SYSU DK019 TaxID=3383140 RepID=UPI003D7CFC6A
MRLAAPAPLDGGRGQRVRALRVRGLARRPLHPLQHPVTGEHGIRFHRVHRTDAGPAH